MDPRIASTPLPDPHPAGPATFGIRDTTTQVIAQRITSSFQLNNAFYYEGWIITYPTTERQFYYTDKMFRHVFTPLNAAAHAEWSKQP